MSDPGIQPRPASLPPPLPRAHRPSGAVLRERAGHLEPIEIEGAFHMLAPDGRTYPLAELQAVEIQMGDGWLSATLFQDDGAFWVEFDFSALARVPLAHRNVLLKMSRREGAVRMLDERPGIVFQLPVGSLRDRIARLVG